MNQQKRFQSGVEFIINLISLLASHAVAFLIFGLIIPRIQNYERNDKVEYAIVLLLSAIIVFLFFSVVINFSVRNREFELISTLKNCFLTYALFSVMLILTKNPIIDSRYLFLSSFAFYIAFSLLGRYVFKHYMIKKISKSKFATRVGVISNYGRACEFIPKLKENWTNNVIAVALIDTDFNENGFVLKNGRSIFDIDGVPVVANADSIIGWIRTASLDEAYINVESMDMLPEYNEIIEELEEEKRGLYGGAVGYFDFNGNMDTCIAIRTMIIKDGNVYMQAGAGIVADSIPEMEYEESHNKVRALVKTIGGEV